MFLCATLKFQTRIPEYSFESTRWSAANSVAECGWSVVINFQGGLLVKSHLITFWWPFGRVKMTFPFHSLGNYELSSPTLLVRFIMLKVPSTSSNIAHQEFEYSCMSF